LSRASRRRGRYLRAPVRSEVLGSADCIDFEFDVDLTRIAAASELCYLGGQQGERERMKQLFVQIGPFVDTIVYGDTGASSRAAG
jgi:hypothetical protein